uniref:Uncharacterized protein n=1 Tax=Fagus sylvatica TaxID=28930 RepID=A0A2N9FIM0_FAGSY
MEFFCWFLFPAAAVQEERRVTLNLGLKKGAWILCIAEGKALLSSLGCWLRWLGFAGWACWLRWLGLLAALAGLAGFAGCGPAGGLCCLVLSSNQFAATALSFFFFFYSTGSF